MDDDRENVVSDIDGDEILFDILAPLREFLGSDFPAEQGNGCRSVRKLLERFLGALAVDLARDFGMDFREVFGPHGRKRLHQG